MLQTKIQERELALQRDNAEQIAHIKDEYERKIHTLHQTNTELRSEVEVVKRESKQVSLRLEQDITRIRNELDVVVRDREHLASNVQTLQVSLQEKVSSIETLKVEQRRTIEEIQIIHEQRRTEYEKREVELVQHQQQIEHKTTTVDQTYKVQIHELETRSVHLETVLKERDLQLQSLLGELEVQKNLLVQTKESHTKEIYTMRQILQEKDTVVHTLRADHAAVSLISQKFGRCFLTFFLLKEDWQFFFFPLVL